MEYTSELERIENIKDVWLAYSTTKDSVLRKELIIQYAYLVKYAAGRISIHTGQRVDFDDLASASIVGLIDAIEKYDIKLGVKFENYASLRIRGEIWDSLRAYDWVPRSVREKNKQLEKVFSELESHLGREPTNAELAERLGLSVKEVCKLIDNSSIITLISLEEYSTEDYGLLHESIRQSADADPAAQYERTELKQILTDAIDKLRPKEKLVVSLYYYEELTLKEISAVMGVTLSRVSQIHSKAIFKLKLKLGKYKSILLV